MSANENSASAGSEAAESSRRQTEASRPPRGGRVSGGLALILSFLALLATGYLWYVLIYQRPELTQMDLPSALAEIERKLSDLETTTAEADDQISAIAETQNTLRAAVDGMHAELGRNRTQWIVNEAEQLLLIANRRLQIARDVGAALAALRAADRQLELLAEPALLPVRREIAKEITQLESLERADVPGIALRLGSLAGSLDQLPFAPDLRGAGEQVAAARRATEETADDTGRSLWRDLIGLVRIRRHDTVQRPLLAPEEQYFARENLRLMLYGAQYALLQGNAATYQQNLETAGRWLRDYYDVNAAAVTAMHEELDRLRAIPLMGELPDISASLDLLRKTSVRRSP